MATTDWLDKHPFPDCPFCPIPPTAKILREWGTSHQIVAFEPLNPVTPGHVLIVPRQHVADLTEHPALSAMVFLAAAEWVKTVLDGDANVITSKGPNATQTVFHLHVHVVPRRAGDGLHLPWTGQHRNELCRGLCDTDGLPHRHEDW